MIHRGQARPVVFDNDADFDDTVALAALAQLHIMGRIDLQAVTITNNGAGLPGKGYLHERCLLDELGLAQVPVADATYDLPHAFPDTLRDAVDLILDHSIPDCESGHRAPAQSAGELLAEKIAHANSRITLIATGPLTNVSVAIDSLNRDYPQGAAGLINRAYVQGGAVNVPGGLEGVPGFDDTQTLNTWGDPASSQAVFTTLRPGSLRLVPHDATNDVPVRVDYIDLINATAQTPAAQYVATLMRNPLIVGAVEAGLAVFWWDPLAALSPTTRDLVEYYWKRISVILDGVSSGRTIESPKGTRMRVGVSADTALFESTLINVLNGTVSQP